METTTNNRLVVDIWPSILYQTIRYLIIHPVQLQTVLRSQSLNDCELLYGQHPEDVNPSYASLVACTTILTTWKLASSCTHFLQHWMESHCISIYISNSLVLCTNLLIVRFTVLGGGFGDYKDGTGLSRSSICSWCFDAVWHFENFLHFVGNAGQRCAYFQCLCWLLACLSVSLKSYWGNSLSSSAWVWHSR